MARTLSQNGYTNMRILHGGYDAWKTAGGPIEAKAGTTPGATAGATPPTK